MDKDNQYKKILIVITKSNWGGAQRYVYDLATSLPRNEFDIEVIVGGEGILKDKLESAGIKVTSLSAMQRDIDMKKEASTFKELLRIFKEKKPDIVHLNSSKAGGLGVVAARIAGVNKIIFTAHAWAFNEKRNIASKILISFLHWFTVIMSHKTIAVSKSVKEDISHFPFINHKIEVVHLGIHPFELVLKNDARELLQKRSVAGQENNSAPEIEIIPTSLQPLEANATVKPKRKKKEIWIGTIAELHPTKGLLYAIDAVSFLIETYPELHFYMIGEGEERENIEKHIQKRRLGDNIHLVGFVDNAKVYLKAFDIFIVSSLSEAFGYVIAEAGFAKLPVVATDVGGIPEVVEDYGILVPPKDAKALSNGIEKILNSKEFGKEIGEKFSKHINQSFSFDAMIENTVAVYRK